MLQYDHTYEYLYNFSIVGSIDSQYIHSQLKIKKTSPFLRQSIFVTEDLIIFCFLVILLFFKWKCCFFLIQVVDATKTNSFLDDAGFSDMISTYKRGKVRKLKDYIECCVIGDADKNCVSIVLDNFVEKGIIGKENKWLGMKRTYPTKDKGK